MRTTSTILAASALAAAAAFAGPPAAAAKDGTASAVGRYLETLEVGRAVEHRLVVLHPILVRKAPPKRGEGLVLASATSGDLFAFGQISAATRTRAEAVSFTGEPVLLLAGDLLRTQVTDLVVGRDTIVVKDKPTGIPLLRVAHEVDPDPADAEPRLLGQVMPSAIRYLVLTGAKSPELRAEADRFAADGKLENPRKSPADLPLSEALAKRVAGYRSAFQTLPPPPKDADTEVVGYAAYVDGALAAIETYANGKLFEGAWPSILAGIASEAGVQEAREDLLAEDLGDPADPDRFTSDLKARILTLFAARVEEGEMKEFGTRLELSVEEAVARAIVLPGERFAHFVLVTDPAHRGDKRTKESPDLNVARRKPRPTEEEKRLLDRRGPDGQPLPPTPQPPQPPPPPEPPK